MMLNMHIKCYYYKNAAPKKKKGEIITKFGKKENERYKTITMLSQYLFLFLRTNLWKTYIICT